MLVFISFLISGIPADIDVASQTKVYDQFIRDNKVGTLTVTINEDSSKDFLECVVKSEVKLNLLVTNAKVDYEGSVQYQNGRLKKSFVEILKNGKPHQKGKTHCKNAKCEAVIDGNNKKISTYPIEYSTLLLYIKEPKNISRVYAEGDGIFNSIEYLGGGKYELDLDGSRNNFYYYENGELVRAKLDHWIAPIILKLRK